MSVSLNAIGDETADATPQSGIVWIYHFQPDGTATLIPNDDIERALADHAGWTWVHLSLADTRCRAWVANNARLSELARETLLGSDEHLAWMCSDRRSSAWCRTCSRKSRKPPTLLFACVS